MKLFETLQELGFGRKEGEIYLTLYQLGAQPASVVAKHAGMERTYAYKALLGFSAKNLVSVAQRNGVKHFFIPDLSVLKRRLAEERERFARKEDEFNLVETEMRQYDSRCASALPKISLHDGAEGVRNLYEEIYAHVESKNYISVRMFASNTIMSRSGGDGVVRTYAHDFFRKLEARGTQVDTLLGNGMWTMESVGRTTSVAELEKLPAANASIQIMVVGRTAYLVVFKDIPFGITLASEELADCLHFLLERVKAG